MSTMNSDTKKTGRKIILRVAPFISIGILIALWFIASGDGSGIIASPQEVVEKIGELTVTPLGGYTLFEPVSYTHLLLELFDFTGRAKVRR